MVNSIDSDGKVNDETEYREQEFRKVVLGQDNGKDVGKEHPNALLVQTLIKQNELLMNMLALKGKKLTEAYVPPDLSKALTTFNGKCKPHKAANWLNTLCDVAELHRWSDALKLGAARVNVDGSARQWYVGRKFVLWTEFERQFKSTFVRSVNVGSRWKALTARVQDRNESILDYYHETIRLRRDLELDFFNTKEQFLEGVQSKELFQHLLSRTHDGEDELLFDIIDYLRIVEQRNGRFQGKLFSTSNEKPKTEVESSKQKAENAGGVSQKGAGLASNRICFNCGFRAHIAPSCPIPTRPKGACYGCGSTKHKRSTCPEREKKIRDADKEESQGQNGQKYTGSSVEIRLLEPAYYVRVSVQVCKDNCVINAVIDSGSPISLITSHMVGINDRQPFKKDILISGINRSQLNIEAVASTTVSLVDYNISKKQVFYIVNNLTMSSKCLLGRDFIKGMNISFGESGIMIINPKQEMGKDDDFMDNLGLIEYEGGDDVELNVGDVPLVDKRRLVEVYNNCYKKAVKPETPEIDYEVNISFKDHTPFNFDLGDYHIPKETQ